MQTIAGHEQRSVTCFTLMRLRHFGIIQEARERFTLSSTRRWCSQSEFRISYPARIYRELKTITLLAPFDRADRNRIAVLAGGGESHGAFHLLGHRHYSPGGIDGARDGGVGRANGRRSRRIIECHVWERGGTDHCRDCALKRSKQRGQSVDCRLDYRQHPTR